ncbi:hypothetical protein C9J03_09405 [Photobacterium gaetbulicola]|uniref:Secreted protein n=1 Tax=Photobacterium gaetbulicola Gung47 TaxID=658445 RepID=A0A0C5WR68_9GAMM|nr:hypothetical protein [Photobacterium gaetbulicola]AJR05455.1 hypothetical protein H744_1c0430 [Photobacterium gaetbulicola Gung47]PSU12774.1 hypothetical protein C9J03_09405 [Photobacterium gaetbulicola]
MKKMAMASSLVVLLSALLAPPTVQAQTMSMICHQTGSGEITLYVNINAVDAHMGHGDYSGACQTNNLPSPLLALSQTPQTQQVVEIDEPPVSWIMMSILPLILLRRSLSNKMLKRKLQQLT